MLAGIVAAAVAVPAAIGRAQESADRVFAHENVLGTSLRLVVRADSDDAAHRLEERVLAEIERLARVVSTWDPGSELARALATPDGVVVSEELGQMLVACDRWRRASHGAFHPGVATVAAIWQRAAAAGREPGADELAAAIVPLAVAPWSYERADRRFTPARDVAITVDGLAKGFVIDRASAVAGDGAAIVVLDIGGDLRVHAEASRPVAVADPRHPADNVAPLATVWLRSAAIASSGGYARGYDVGGVHHSHLLDPRTGKPCDDVLGATVIAADATAADALATILAVLGADDGLPVVERAGAAGVVVARDGSVRESRSWQRWLKPGGEGGPVGGDDVGAANGGDAKPASVPVPAAAAAAAAARDPSPWPAGSTFAVELEIRAPEAAGGRRGGYRRPYVAVWIEKPTGEPVRTLALWVEKPRWLSDLRRWYKLYRADRDLIDTVSRATRKPGRYELAWDGLDDHGKAIANGDFVVCIEAAREHGTYQTMKQPIRVGEASYLHDLAGNVEIAGARIRFGPEKPK